MTATRKTAAKKTTVGRVRSDASQGVRVVGGPKTDAGGRPQTDQGGRPVVFHLVPDETPDDAA